MSDWLRWKARREIDASELSALGQHIIDQWQAQVITTQCRCSLLVAGYPAFKIGDVWHCDEHRLANVKIVAVRRASLAQREELCK